MSEKFWDSISYNRNFCSLRFIRLLIRAGFFLIFILVFVSLDFVVCSK